MVLQTVENLHYRILQWKHLVEDVRKLYFIGLFAVYS